MRGESSFAISRCHDAQQSPIPAEARPIRLRVAHDKGRRRSSPQQVPHGSLAQRIGYLQNRFDTHAWAPEHGRVDGRRKHWHDKEIMHEHRNTPLPIVSPR